MRGMIVLGIAMAAAALTGCATQQEWAEWRAHPAHFASQDHAVFSVRNRDDARTRVTRTDVDRARTQSWWGRAITVDQAAILEN